MRSRLETPRLTLQVCEPADADALHAIFSDPATHTLGGGPYTDIEQTRDWIRRRQARRHEYGLTWYVLRQRGSGDVIGNAGLFMHRAAPDPEFGFEILKTEQGNGYGTEAAAAVIAEAHDSGLERIWATVRTWNAASLRVLKKLAFVPSHTTTDERGELVYLVHRGR